MPEVLTVGVGVPAPVDPATGRIVSVGILRGWDGVSVTEVLERRLGVPVRVDNDSNLGALAELRIGAARGYRDVVYLKVSHGVGSGLIVDGRVLHGRSGAAGEFGHITIDDNGPICRCGNRGCLDALIGAPALLRMLEASHGHLTLPDVIARAQDGDPGCRRVISDAGRLLAVGAANTCNLFDPELVVVGGRLAEAGPILLDTFRSVLAQRTLPSTAGPVEVVASELGTAAEVRGALALALDHAGIAGTVAMAG
jgi:predicted NBD/HSP70 family sugar kinase